MDWVALKLGSESAQEFWADFSPIHPSQQLEKKSSLGLYLVPMFSLDYLVM